MRELKFRVWKSFGKMEYNVFPTGRGRYGKWVGNPDIETRFSEAGTNDAILMQFTGVVDRDGNDIYEGDIVSVPSIDPRGTIDTGLEDGRCVVDFEHGRFGIMRSEFMPLTDWMKQTSGPYRPNYGNIIIFGDCVLKVIGNIHKNDSLLNYMRP
jgi:hypothetical protein